MNWEQPPTLHAGDLHLTSTETWDRVDLKQGKLSEGKSNKKVSSKQGSHSTGIIKKNVYLGPATSCSLSLLDPRQSNQA